MKGIFLITTSVALLSNLVSEAHGPSKSRYKRSDTNACDLNKKGDCEDSTDDADDDAALCSIDKTEDNSDKDTGGQSINPDNDNEKNENWKDVLELNGGGTEPGWAQNDTECNEQLITVPKNNKTNVKFGSYPMPISYINVFCDDESFQGMMITQGGLQDKIVSISFRGAQQSERTYLAMFCWNKKK